MLVAELESAISNIADDLRIFADKVECSVEFETYFTEKIIEQLGQLSYGYLIDTKDISMLEKAKLTHFWRVSYDDTLFTNFNFTIKLYSKADVILEVISVDGMQNIIKKHR